MRWVGSVGDEARFKSKIRKKVQGWLVCLKMKRPGGKHDFI